MEFQGVSSGKVILLGEHAVVHGVTALAAGIGSGAHATVRPSTRQPSLTICDARRTWVLEPDSDLAHAFQILNDFVGVCVHAKTRIDIPTRAGLGSSACLGVALARAMLRLRGNFDNTDVIKAASAWEGVFHGNPSGIDVSVAAHGGCISFKRGVGVTRLDLLSPVPLCVGDTGLRSSTREMVAHVTGELARRADGGRSLLDGVGACVHRAQGALALGDWMQLGDAMRDNHALLRTLGLSNLETETLCESACSAGAIAAKITGAGGGGCVIALAPGHQQDVLNAWQEDGFRGFVVNAGLDSGAFNESPESEA